MFVSVPVSVSMSVSASVSLVCLTLAYFRNYS